MSGMNSLFELRKKHISSLFTNFPLLQLNQDNYKVKLESGHTVIVILNSTFPESPPRILVKGFSHPILEREYITHDKLLNWNQHVSLVSILKDVNSAFESVAPVENLGNSGNSGNSDKTQNIYPELLLKSLSELQELDSDLLALDDFFEELSSIKKKVDQLERLYSTNYEIASKTMKKEHDYSLKIKEYQLLFSKHAQFRKEFDDLWYKYQNSILVFLIM